MILTRVIHQIWASLQNYSMALHYTTTLDWDTRGSLRPLPLITLPYPAILLPPPPKAKQAAFDILI